MARFLIILGLILLAAGVLWPILQRLGLGRLPGDLVIERGNVRIYLPLLSSLIVSLLLTLILWLLNR